MKSYNALSEADLAEYYLQDKGGADYLPTTAAELVSDVERYLRSSNLDHRAGERAAIASEALRIAQEIREQRAVLPSHAEVAFVDNMQQGLGDQRADLDQMYDGHRISRGLVEFLSGARAAELPLRRAATDDQSWRSLQG